MCLNIRSIIYIADHAYRFVKKYETVMDHLCIFVLCYAFERVCLLMPCGHLLGKVDLLALVCDV